MSSEIRNKIVSSKIEILAEQRNNLAKRAKQLQTVVEEIHEVLQLATSWLGNADDTNSFTFTDINKMIEDKLVFLSSTDVSVGCESVTDHQHESATISLQPASTSTDQSVPARTGQVSVLPEELKTVMNQVKVMQDAMSFLSTSSEKLSEKQLTMEKSLESLSDKYSTNQHQKFREIETELKIISGKQKETSSQQKRTRTDFEMKIQSFEKKENLRLEELSQQFMQDVNDVLGNIHELKERISCLENQTAIDTQLEALKKNVEFLGASSDDLSGKFREHVLSCEEFTTRIDETITNMSSGHGREFEKLQKFEEKIAALEISWIKTSQETKKSCQGVETKYEMVCQVLTDRLLPLEKLRDIFNEKMDVRTENIRKMNTICDQMAVLQPKLSQLVLPEELKTVMNQVKVMQEAMSFFSTSSEKLSEKHLTLEKCHESLSDKYSTTEHQKIREIETELKSICDKQKKTSSHQEKLRNDFEMKIQSFEKGENLRLKEQSEQFMQDVNDVLGNVHELAKRISCLEHQPVISAQLEVLKKNVEFLGASSDDLSRKFREHVLSCKEFTTRIDKTITNMSSGYGREFEKLQRFEGKIAALEMSWSKTSQETKKSYQGVETKMNTVCDQIAVLHPKLSQLEKQTQRQAIGFSTYHELFTIHPVTDTIITDFSYIISNNGNHFDPRKGVFTAPLDGLYAASLHIYFNWDGYIILTIRKRPCTCNDTSVCNKCGIARILRHMKYDTRASTFAVTYMKAGEMFYVECNNVNTNTSIDCQIRLSCFKIN